MSFSNIMKIHDLKQACKSCNLRDLCLPVGISNADLELLESIISRRRPLHRGDVLYQAGHTLSCLYAVRAGSMKTTIVTDDGEEQITGFHLPGELLGLDAIGDEVHPCTAVALETTSVCEIPFDRLGEVSLQTPGLQQQLLRIMSRELHGDEQLMLLLGKRASDARVAAFLLNLSDRFAERGFSRHEFNLSMSRIDISNYLGLAVETVSRMFSRFQSLGLVDIDKRLVTIRDAEGLRQIAGTRDTEGQRPLRGSADGG